MATSLRANIMKEGAPADGRKAIPFDESSVLDDAGVKEIAKVSGDRLEQCEEKTYKI